MYIIHLYEYLRLHNAVDRLLDVGLVDVGLGQLLVPVGGQPDAGQRALLGQHEVGVEHAAAAVVLVVDGDKNSCNVIRNFVSFIDAVGDRIAGTGDELSNKPMPHNPCATGAMNAAQAKKNWRQIVQSSDFNENWRDCLHFASF